MMLEPVLDKEKGDAYEHRLFDFAKSLPLFQESYPTDAAVSTLFPSIFTRDSMAKEERRKSLVCSV